MGETLHLFKLKIMGIQTIKIPIGDTYIKQGDTIPKITVTFADTDVIDLTTVGTEIKMQVYYKGQAFINLSIGAGITVISAKVFEIDTMEALNFPCGNHLGDLEITIDGVRFTYFNVEYTILKQYTI